MKNIIISELEEYCRTNELKKFSYSTADQFTGAIALPTRFDVEFTEIKVMHKTGIVYFGVKDQPYFFRIAAIKNIMAEKKRGRCEYDIVFECSNIYKNNDTEYVKISAYS